ncbi:MAG TPA: hypothetical protein VGG71_03775 [Chitinophagaceae bacterium]
MTDSISKIKRPMPQMWVRKELSSRLQGNFNLQHFQLSSLIGTKETDSIFLPIDDLKIMLESFDSTHKYLQVFLACYDAGPDVDEKDKNKLTLLFGTSKSLTTDAPYPLYSIRTNGGSGLDPNSERWVTEYMVRKMPVLSSNIDRNPYDNHCDKSKALINTRRISYDVADILELIETIKYLDKIPKTVSGFQAVFSSYCFKGKPDAKSPCLVNRIFVIFEFTTKVDGKNIVFYLDDIPEFEKPNLKNKQITPLEMLGVDNGHLCPPNC